MHKYQDLLAGHRRVCAGPYTLPRAMCGHFIRYRRRTAPPKYPALSKRPRFKAQLERQHYLAFMPGAELMSLETLQIKGCWKAFLEADVECVTALADLSSTILPTTGMFYAIEKLVCQLYLPKTKISSLKDLRRLPFRRKQAESERLPPPQAALREAFKRAHYQAMIWANDKVQTNGCR